MLLGIGIGCLLGAIFPVVRDETGTVVSPGATVLEPLGTVFINLMFCVVVPMVFCSICAAIANMDSAGRAGKIMGITLATFLITAAIASVVMYAVVRVIPLVQGDYIALEQTGVQRVQAGKLVVDFFTKPDFCELLSRKAILPLIVFAVLCGFGIQRSGGKESMSAKLLADVSACIMNVVKIITYYAPIGFLGFFGFKIKYTFNSTFNLNIGIMNDIITDYGYVYYFGV